jgi:hypothetical protein
MVMMCEQCNDKQASFGSTIDRVKRWCASCGKEHGVVYLGERRMCEQCNDKLASHGTTIDRVKRWCASCGKEHGAVRLCARKMCEQCNDKRASFGSTIDRVKRWCASCGEEHGAVSLRAKKMCEHCSLNPARRDRVSSCAKMPVINNFSGDWADHSPAAGEPAGGFSSRWRTGGRILQPLENRGADPPKD